jgi:ABC-type glycerol-3-phosphate transport system substrate-binding protein
MATRRRVVGVWAWGTVGTAGTALLAPAGLAACATSQSGPANTPATVIAQLAKAQTPVTLQFWEHPTWSWSTGVGKEIAAPLLAANPWLKLENPPSGQNRSNFLAATAAGTPPDMYSAGGYWTQTDFVDGATMSIERFIATSGAVKKADLWASLRRDAEFRGHMTAMPYAPDTRFIFVHEENARAAGLDPGKPPTKWSEFEVAVKRAFQGSSGTVTRLGWHPFAGAGGNWHWMVPYWQLGGELLNADQTKVTIFNERAIEGLTWLMRVVDAQGGGQALEAFRGTFPNTAGSTMFVNGGTTFLYDPLFQRSTVFRPAAPTMRFDLFSYPLPDKGGTVANYGGSPCLSIAKGSKHPEVAWLFIEHVTNAENNIKLALAGDLVPIRESSTKSAAYVGNDKARALQAQEMTKSRFVISAPGGAEMLPHQNVIAPLMAGQQSIQAALREKEQVLQEILDRYLVKAKSLVL